MSQSSSLGAVPTGTGATVRAAFNAGLQALASDNEGGSAPSPTYPFMRWRNSAAGQLKRRNALNSGWEMLENYAASTDPGTSDDAGTGYVRGSLWVNTAANRIWWCLDPSTGAAKWLALGAPGFDASQVLSVSASNTTSPTTVGTWTLPANTFATDGACVDFEIYGTVLNNTGSTVNMVLALNVGATNIIADTASGFVTSGSLRLWRLKGSVWRASSSLVKAAMSYFVLDGQSTAPAGRGDFALGPIVGERLMMAAAAGVAATWTADQTFSVTWQMLAASAQCSITAEYLKCTMVEGSGRQGRG